MLIIATNVRHLEGNLFASREIVPVVLEMWNYDLLDLICYHACSPWRMTGDTATILAEKPTV